MKRALQGIWGYRDCKQSTAQGWWFPSTLLSLVPVLLPTVPAVPEPPPCCKPGDNSQHTCPWHQLKSSEWVKVVLGSSVRWQHPAQPHQAHRTDTRFNGRILQGHEDISNNWEARAGWATGTRCSRARGAPSTEMLAPGLPHNTESRRAVWYR